MYKTLTFWSLNFPLSCIFVVIMYSAIISATLCSQESISVIQNQRVTKTLHCKQFVMVGISIPLLYHYIDIMPYVPKYLATLMS